MTATPITPGRRPLGSARSPGGRPATHHCPTGAHPQPHTSCYSGHDCRCPGCREAAVDYSRQRRRQVAYGRWAGLSDAARCQAIIRALREQGATDEWVGEQAGVSTVAVGYIRRGLRDTVRAPTERALSDLHRRVGSGEVVPPGYREAQRRRLVRERRRAYREVAA